MKIKDSPYWNLMAACFNIALVFVAYMVTRVAFVLENWSLYSSGWASLDTGRLLSGSLLFDAAAIAYTNAIYFILILLPPLCFRQWWQTMLKWLFVAVNTLALSANLADAVYSQYTGRRTTWSFFSEFSNESNLGSIFFQEIANHWYLILTGIALAAALIFLYTKPSGHRQKSTVVAHIAAIAIAVPLSIGAIRGGFSPRLHPIVSSKANEYVNTPGEAAIVLNTPFSMIRSIGGQTFANPHYFDDDDLDNLFSPIHHNPAASHSIGNRNVVILILESFGREYFGFYNPDYVTHTPFLDSLLANSLTFEHTFANGRKSIDAMPSVLSSIPMFIEPFFTSTTSLNRVGGLAECLADKGYTTAFFHGADNTSMGFNAFARTTGFQHYFGRTEYDQDSRFGGENDFDGTWAIWDEEFLQFFALQAGNLHQPFLATVFTATSHHPFAIPQRYRTTFPEEDIPLLKCIRYSDNALRKYFDTAKQQPWYDSTIFILTADHTSATAHDLYRTAIGVFSIPIIIFDPSGQLPRGILPGVAAQIDIMPTLLGLLGYDRPFLSYGKDLLSADTPAWTVNYCNDIYQYIDGEYLLQFDGRRTTAFYNYVTDPMLQHNLVGSQPEREAAMATRLKAIIQSYMMRMSANDLTVTDAGRH